METTQQSLTKNHFSKRETFVALIFQKKSELAHLSLIKSNRNKANELGQGKKCHS